MDRVITELGEDAWTAMSCGDGAHGPRIYDWAITDIRPLRLVDRGHWLPARRSRTDPTDIAYYVCFETPRKRGHAIRSRPYPDPVVVQRDPPLMEPDHHTDHPHHPPYPALARLATNKSNPCPHQSLHPTRPSQPVVAVLRPAFWEMLSWLRPEY